MSDVPKVDDPVLAVILDRLARISQDFSDHRASIKEEISDLHSEISEVRKDQAQVNAVMQKAQGGYLVILGLGAMVSCVVGFWSQLAKLFGKA